MPTLNNPSGDEVVTILREAASAAAEIQRERPEKVDPIVRARLMEGINSGLVDSISFHGEVETDENDFPVRVTEITEYRVGEFEPRAAGEVPREARPIPHALPVRYRGETGDRIAARWTHLEAPRWS